MLNTDANRLSIAADVTLREAMKQLDKTAEKCLFVVEGNGALLGALTDGDVRRAILAGRSLDGTIHDVYNAKPVMVHAVGAVDTAEERKQALSLMVSRKVEVVPVVDSGNQIVRYYTWTELSEGTAEPKRPPLDVPVVVMAGGFGTRLEPFTKVLPKPLIPVRDKPIIEHIIDRFVDTGASEFWLTVNYKSRILKAYFEDRDPDYTVHFVDEPEPMGTAGSLRLLGDQIDDSFFVTNCDIIVDADYTKVLEYHRATNNLVTLVGSTIHYQIPYGTCILDDNGRLERIDEKPGYDFLVNTGMYVLDPKALGLIPSDDLFHMTHLIDKAIATGHPVGVFPVSEEAWIDVGQWQEYQKAASRL